MMRAGAVAAAWARRKGKSSLLNALFSADGGLDAALRAARSDDLDSARRLWNEGPFKVDPGRNSCTKGIDVCWPPEAVADFVKRVKGPDAEVAREAGASALVVADLEGRGHARGDYDTRLASIGLLCSAATVYSTTTLPTLKDLLLKDLGLLLMAANAVAGDAAPAAGAGAGGAAGGGGGGAAHQFGHLHIVVRDCSLESADCVSLSRQHAQEELRKLLEPDEDNNRNHTRQQLVERFRSINREQDCSGGGGGVRCACVPHDRCIPECSMAAAASEQ